MDNTTAVTIYSTPTCGYCKQAKSFLHDHSIDFTEHDVSKDKKKHSEMVTKSGQMGVPVITVGEQVVVGFDQLRLKELLDI